MKEITVVLVKQNLQVKAFRGNNAKCMRIANFCCMNRQPAFRLTVNPCGVGE